MQTKDKSKFKHLLEHNVSDVITRKELEEKLSTGKKLNIKFGIDPTGTHLHIGHMVVINKLKEFQDLGHNIILLFGNFTAQIGDPTGKSESRKPLTQLQVESNAKTYLEQVGKVLDLTKVKVVWNADWLGKFTFSDVLRLAANFTVAQMLERDMFQERMKKDLPIGLHEFLYPLMQGYDSVALNADVELGGNDQLFNMLAARPLQKAEDQTPQCVMTCKILVGTDGTRKMGKSEGNFIPVLDSPEQMFGKIMSIPDSIIYEYFEMATRLTESELADIKKRLASGENPKNLKVELGKAIISIYHSAEAGEEAAANFQKVFAEKEIPDDIKEIKVKETSKSLLDLLIEHNLVKSKSDARRLIDGGGIKVDKIKVTDYNLVLELQKEKLVQVGKRVFVKFLH